MADDERSDARDPEVAAWLEVEPLDDLTRRRLVSTALRETDGEDAPLAAPRSSRSYAWRWIAVAAAVVVLLVGGLALFTAPGGNDEQATRALSPHAFDQALAAAPAAGDFGDLDDAGNLAALRAALDVPSGDAKATAEPAAPRAAGDTSGSATPESATPESAAAAAGAPASGAPASGASCVRGAVGTVVGRATGTIDGRPVTVVLLEGADGARSLDALFQDSCELRHLATVPKP